MNDLTKEYAKILGVIFGLMALVFLLFGCDPIYDDLNYRMLEDSPEIDIENPPIKIKSYPFTHSSSEIENIYIIEVAETVELEVFIEGASFSFFGLEDQIYMEAKPIPGIFELVVDNPEKEKYTLHVLGEFP